jgi:hypothetical protein
VAPLDGFGRLTIGAMQASADMEGTRTGGGHCLDIRLVVIGDHLVRDHSGVLDGLAEERLGAGRVTVLAKEDIHDHAVLINGAIQIALLVLTE